MRFHEVVQPYPTPENYPYAVVASIHSSLWSQMRKFIEACPDDYHLFDKIEPEPSFIIHVGCASEATRKRFEAEWG